MYSWQVMRSIKDNITEEILLDEIHETIQLPMYADRIQRDSKPHSVRRKWWVVWLLNQGYISVCCRWKFSDEDRSQLQFSFSCLPVKGSLCIWVAKLAYNKSIVAQGWLRSLSGRASYCTPAVIWIQLVHSTYPWPSASDSWFFPLKASGSKGLAIGCRVYYSL